MVNWIGEKLLLLLNMELYTQVNPHPSQVKCNHRTKFASIGSCFSEHIARRLERYRFSVKMNPNGIVFHPEPLGRSMIKCIEGNLTCDLDLIDTPLGFVSLDHHGSFRSRNKEILLQSIQESEINFSKQLLASDVLIITWGTAWGYLNKENKNVVANCHKLPGNHFVKVLSDTQMMCENWEQLLNKTLSINPRLKVMFTVSPVRHTREGLIENQRSKARLIELAHRLTEKVPQTSYFPSYEIMIDELRDYRFYERDLIHPNALAVDIIWNRWVNTYMDEPTKLVMQKMDPLLMRLEHRGLHETAEETLERQREVGVLLGQLIL